MRQLLPGLAAAAFFISATTIEAQQGSVQITGAGQVVTGDVARLGGQRQVEPDLGVSWLQPGKRFGLFQVELRASRRGKDPHLGRAYLAFRDVKAGRVTWTIEAGDTYFSPAIGEYRLSNLFTPPVMLTGGAVTARTKTTTVSLLGGRASAWRNIFGTDPDTLDQTMGLARLSHRFNDRVDVNLRASRVRTTNLQEFSFTIAASDQAGGGMRVAVTPDVYLVADASAVSYRRAGSTEWEHEPSYVAGASWLHKRGWVQVNASRFSPGEFPVLNYPLYDREGIFAAADLDVLPRVRMSGGWELFRTNLDTAASLAGTRPPPRSTGERQFAGVRVRLWSRSTFTVRAEQGDRRSRPVRVGALQDSDTGSWTAEWQTAVGRVNSFARYARRESVDNINAPMSYTQHDGSVLAFLNLGRGSQLFGTATYTRNVSSLFSSTYWQAGGGTQLQVGRRDLWLRAEGTLARNIDETTQSFIPRESLSLGVNGQLTRHTAVAVNVNIDRSPMPLMTGSPWLTRSLFRVVRTLPLGSAYAPTTATRGEAGTARGTGAVVGTVYADWNANGVPDEGEETLEGIAVRVMPDAATTTGRDGQFSFPAVPVGAREVGLDPSAIPIDFDPPAATSVQLEIARGDTRRVAFGLVPLGLIQGQVMRDANGNGTLDPSDEPIDGAVVILDDAARSEQVRGGRYRFEAVRNGNHAVKLLIESLPAGAKIAGSDEAKVALARGELTATASFLVSLEKRPEIRKVFPPKGGTAGAAGRAAPRNALAPRGGNAAPRVAAKPERTIPPPPAARPALLRASARASAYAVQVTALADVDRAREVAIRLSVSGLPSYLLEPAAGENVYRVRVGPYRTRAEAEKAAAALEGMLGVKLWVTREMQ